MPFWGAEGMFGNASSVQHSYGSEASDAVEMARKKMALLVGARLSEIVWVSGATEANNLAIQGVLKAPAKKPRRLVTVCTEHNAVLDVAKAARQDGHQVVVLPVNSKGIVNVDKLHEHIRDGKALVSVMWVNNETGVIQPIEEISQICQKCGALLHVDAAQALGKVRIDLRKLPLDLMSLSAHKIYGPKGIGALFVRRGVALRPLCWGGGQEKGLRAGTLPVPLIVGMGKAGELVSKEWKKQHTQATRWHDSVIATVREIGGQSNGDCSKKVPHILNISFEKASGSLIGTLKHIAVSNGAACSTAKVTASHVLRGMGLKKSIAMNSLRISFGRFTTDDDVQMLIRELRRNIPRLSST